MAGQIMIGRGGSNQGSPRQAPELTGCLDYGTENRTADWTRTSPVVAAT